jgi:hypothetical protein
MGWAGATDIFDGAVEVGLRLLPAQPLDTMDARVSKVVHDMYTQIDWADWDTQDESEYFDPYLRQVMIDIGEIDAEDLD